MARFEPTSLLFSHRRLRIANAASRPSGEIGGRISQHMADTERVWLGSSKTICDDAKETFLTLLAPIVESGDRETMIDFTLDYFDELLVNQKMDQCKAELAMIDDRLIKDVDSSVLVSILGITLSASNLLLPDRERFYERTVATIAGRKGKRFATELLGKYR